MRNITINHSFPLGKSSWEVRLWLASYLVSMDSEPGKQVASCILLPVGIDLLIFVCGPRYSLPLHSARDSLPVVASSHQLLMGTSSRFINTSSPVALEPAWCHLPVYDCLLLFWSVVCFLLFDIQRVIFLFPFLGEIHECCSHFLPTHIINPLKSCVCYIYVGIIIYSPAA